MQKIKDLFKNYGWTVIMCFAGVALFMFGLIHLDNTKSDFGWYTTIVAMIAGILLFIFGLLVIYKNSNSKKSG